MRRGEIGGPVGNRSKGNFNSWCKKGSAWKCVSTEKRVDGKYLGGMKTEDRQKWRGAERTRGAEKVGREKRAYEKLR